MLRAELIKAQENLAKKDPPKDLKSEIMMRVIKGEVRLLVTANKDQDIMTALRLAKEFNLKIVLDGVADAQLVLNEIKASGFPVIIHPTMARPGGDSENLSMETAALAGLELGPVGTMLLVALFRSFKRRKWL